MISFGVRKVLYNQCDPGSPLDPDDVRNVDVDRYGEAGSLVRGVRWVDRLANAIELAEDPAVMLFTGLPGSGKSTELRRLAAQLEEPGRANLVPVLVDGEDALDLTSPIDVPDILAAVVHACDVRVRQLEGASDADAERLAVSEGYLSRFWAWLVNTDAELGRGELGLGAGSKLVVELKTRPTLRQRVRATVAAHLSSFLVAIREELERLDARARDQHKGGLVVLFDSLEKLRGTSSNWDAVLGSAEQLFAGGAPYLKLPVHVVYTIPPALVSRRVERVSFMPMIKLTDRDGRRFDAGWDAARQIVHQRIPPENLAELLGPHHEARLDRVIAWSGGYPRELVQLLRALVLGEEFPVPDHELDRVLYEVRDGYRKVVPAEAFPWLAQVALDRYLTLNDERHRPAADLMLTNNVVLRYLNSEDWFDLHPAVKEIPGIQQAVQALRAARAAAGDG